MIQSRMKINGIEHFTFHPGSPNEALLAGTRHANRGRPPARGPGRHLLASNWSWYFNSLFGCKNAYNADMDLHDDRWQPRDVVITADVAQLFLFNKIDK